MDTTAQWPQGIGLINKPMEAISSRGSSVGLQKRSTSSSSTRAHNKDQILNCPRCNSINTKFCYYNNYSLSQPRYLCKTCRRYWTQGGSLRNVPVGGGSRKHNKRSSSTTTSTSTSSPTTSSQALSKMIMIKSGGQDLNLAYHPAAPTLHNHDHHHQNYGSNTTSNNINMISSSSRGLISSLIMPPPVVPGSDSNTLYPTGLMFPLQDFKPTLNFSLDQYQHHHHQQHHWYGSSSLQQDQVQGGTSSTRLLFPFNDLLKEKVKSSSTDFNEHKNGQEERDSSTTSGYNWNNNNNSNQCQQWNVECRVKVMKWTRRRTLGV
ncbi:hypothetical protein Dsin_001133 [Dipteronia sinensis]|uniref:Dof zinc finger protein n=1 Tax=Dipteronia sinensis TaxID=43782 RepID=A0AAE0EIQ3_9ROSI|nr:hypothetical protein Dsin_001133 [Dipteronia sinensis]